MKDINSGEKHLNVLLVYPEYPQTFWGFGHAIKFISKKAVYPPLGLLTIAAMLPEEWDKNLIDMNVRSLKDKEIQRADIIFISAMLIQESSVRNIIERCHKAGKRIVVGGPLFTANPDQFYDVDHLVLNEGEITFPPFLKDLINKTAQKRYGSEEFPPLRLSPIPDWALINHKKYVSLSIQYSRGCPFDCEFCDIKVLFGKRVRTKDLSQIENELDMMYSIGWRGGVFFVDDNFIGNVKKLKNEILPGLIRWQSKNKSPFSFSTEASINIAKDDALLHLLVEAGFNSVFIGIETPNVSSLKECGKIQNENVDLVESVKKIQSYGIEVKGGFIVGFDSDPQSIFDRQIEFIKKSGIIVAMVGLLNAPKNSKLYKRLKSENRITGEQSGNNTGFSMNFIPKMNFEVLLSGYTRIIKELYSAKTYYLRVKNYLKNCNAVHSGKSKLNFADIKALFRSLFVLGVKDKGRKFYWKLFFWTIFRCPRNFPLAITYSIYGFHFRKLFQI